MHVCVVGRYSVAALVAALLAAPAAADCLPPELNDLLLQSPIVALGTVTGVEKVSDDHDKVTLAVSREWRGPASKTLTFLQRREVEEDDSPVPAGAEIVIWARPAADGSIRLIKGCGTPLQLSPELATALDAHFGKRRQPFAAAIEEIERMIGADHREAAAVVLASLVTENPEQEAIRFFHQARLEAKLGNYVRALGKAEAAVRLNPDWDVARFNLACYAARAGSTALALKVIDELAMRLRRGDAATRKRLTGLLKSDHDLDSLRGEARFKKTLAKLRQ